MKLLFKSLSILGLGALLLSGCDNKEADLLTSKLYFENSDNLITVKSEQSMNIELKSRLTSKNNTDVNVTYSIGDSALVEAYNARFGKEYKFFSPKNVELSTLKSIIHSGDIYSDKVDLKLNNLNDMKQGDTYLLPICVNTTDVNVISGSEVTYYIVNKFVEIRKAAKFYRGHIKLDLLPTDAFEAVTYEAIVCVNHFNPNNTIMGCEGTMIMRIGDAGGGSIPKDMLQMAGNAEMAYSDLIKGHQWYHLAFTNNSEGKAKLFVNGEVVVEGNFRMSSDLTAGGSSHGFSIGKVPNFKWGERPFNGWMSEVRLWNVERTPSQIKENMLTVDPKTPGLVGYFKLDSSTENLAEGGKQPKEVVGISIEELPKPIAIGEKFNND